MATDVVTIWNQTLSAAGDRGNISDETEAGRGADLCRLWYPLVRDNVMKAASWPSSTKSDYLPLLATRDFNVDWVVTDPAPTWKYVYSTPTDMLAPFRLESYDRFIRQFYAAQDVNAIHTNKEQAILFYAFRQEDVTKWDNGLENAIIHSLAAQITVPLGGKRTLAEFNQDKAVDAVLLAQTDIANESEDHYEEVPTWIAARGYDELPRQTRFTYPYETLRGLTA